MRKIKQLEQQISQLSEVIEFLSNYDRDDIITCCSGGLLRMHGIKYLYKNKVKTAYFSFSTPQLITIIQKDKYQAILKSQICNLCRYYLLNKENGTLVEIPKPDFKNDIENKTISTETNE